MTSHLPRRVTIREVGPRDGLQAEKPLPVPLRAGLIDMLSGAELPKIAELGAVGVSLGDTTGMANPAKVWELVPLLRDRLPGVRLNCHFHDTRGAALANVVAAMEVGIDEFDAGIGGMGGSPFAPGPNGN